MFAELILLNHTLLTQTVGCSKVIMKEQTGIGGADLHDFVIHLPTKQQPRVTSTKLRPILSVCRQLQPTAQLKALLAGLAAEMHLDPEQPLAHNT